MTVSAPERLVTVISLVPNAHKGIGHHLVYHRSVGVAARLCGWEHVILVSRDEWQGAGPPQGCQVSFRTGLVNEGLPSALRSRRPLQLVRDMLQMRTDLVVALKEQLDSHAGDCVVFLDDFNGPQLVATASALAALRHERLHFWLMYRYPPDHGGLIAGLYRRVVRRLARRLPLGHLKLLADSEPLANELRPAFGLPVKVMPIPHALSDAARPFPGSTGELVCWWPGAPRPEKGLASIMALTVTRAEGADAGMPIRLVISEDVPIEGAQATVAITRVPNGMTTADYRRWMTTVDVVLLPYTGPRYRASTSGIFVECVAAGAIPLVSAGTWMAGELKRHGLEGLVCDWREPKMVLTRIRSVCADGLLRDRLDEMRRNYRRSHSEASYAAHMRAMMGAGTTGTQDAAT